MVGKENNTMASHATVSTDETRGNATDSSGDHGARLFADGGKFQTKQRVLPPLPPIEAADAPIQLTAAQKRSYEVLSHENIGPSSPIGSHTDWVSVPARSWATRSARAWSARRSRRNCSSRSTR